jgi:diamine N-acetyltransferase
MQLRLEPITKDNWRKAIKLNVDETQKSFVAPNYYSTIEAMFEPENLSARAAYDGEDMVGFVMYGFDPEVNPRRYWIVRLMVDMNHQRKGYGRAIMQQTIDILKQKSDCDAIYISFVPENQTARALYTSLGFEDTGTMEDGETVFKLPLKQEIAG